ncbi:hypothetical protein PHET_10222, partial [Paragonimus heterotremus]
LYLTKECDNLGMFAKVCKSAVTKGIEFLSEQVQKMDPEDTCKVKTPFVLNTIRSKQSLCINHAEKHEINTYIVHFYFLHQLIAIDLCEIEFPDFVDCYPIAPSGVLDRTRSDLC